jgi:glycosyltransferase involved in cell wall biosynthesis
MAFAVIRVVEARVGATLTASVANGFKIAILSPRIYSVFFPDFNKRSAGGAETQQKLLIEHLANQGCEVVVVCYGPKPDQEIQIKPRIRIFTLPNAGRRGVRGLRFLYPTISDACTVLMKNKPQIIYQRTAGFATAAAAIASRRLGVPFVYACASDLELISNGSTLDTDARVRASFNFGLKMASHVLVQNQSQLAAAGSRLDFKTSLLPNMIEANQNQPLQSKSTKKDQILWIGSLQAVKRPDRFIDIVRRSPQWNFHMICSSTGDVHRELPFQAMMALAKQLPNLVITPFVDPSCIHKYYEQSSLLINTSDSEGFPNTFLEAWRCGVPVISFVDPKVGDAMMPQRVVRTDHEMIVVINRLMSNLALREAIAKRSIEYVHSFHDTKVVIPKYLSLFKQLTNAPELQLR